jgi:hypothetical protein
MKEQHVAFAKGNLAAILKRVNELREEFNELEYKDIAINDGGNGDIKLSFSYEHKKEIKSKLSVEDKLKKLVSLSRQSVFYNSHNLEKSLNNYLEELIKEFSGK